MAQVLPPSPVGIPPGHSFWNDWYEKLRTLVNSINDSIGAGIVSLNIEGFITNGSDLSGDIADPDSTGLVLSSPNGTRWRIVVDNLGVLDTEAI